MFLPEERVGRTRTPLQFVRDLLWGSAAAGFIRVVRLPNGERDIVLNEAVIDAAFPALR